MGLSLSSHQFDKDFLKSQPYFRAVSPWLLGDNQIAVVYGERRSRKVPNPMETEEGENS